MRSEIVPNAFLFISIKYNLHLENFWVEAFCTTPLSMIMNGAVKGD